MRYDLSCGPDPERVVQRAAVDAGAAAAAAASRHQASRSAPTTSRRCSRWGSSRRRCRPSRGSTSPARCSTSCGCGGRRRSCAPSGSSARSARRRASTSRTSRCRRRVRTRPNTAVPQAFYNQAEGIARLATETGAGQWGTRAGVRVRAVRPRVQGVHGAGVVRAEAVPQDPHGDVGRVGRAVTGRRPRPPRFARARDQRRGARRRDARRHALLARVGAQPRAAAPDRHRARGEGAARSSPARSGPTS